MGETWRDFLKGLLTGIKIILGVVMKTGTKTSKTNPCDFSASQEAPQIRQVVMDEAGQAPEPEALCLLTLAKFAHHAVLLGDHKQLRPILRSKARMGSTLLTRQQLVLSWFS
jgi:superfamily I DNA and/or RNA helicase